MLTAHEVLVMTRNLVDKHGWHQGSAKNHVTGEICVGHGLYLARGGMYGLFAEVGSLDEARHALITTQPETIPGLRSHSHVTINDQHITSKEEALAWLDRAIAFTAPAPEEVELEVPVEEYV